MTRSDRTLLYKYSLRGMLYEIMEKAHFDDNSIEEGKVKLIQEIRSIRENIKEWHGFDNEYVSQLQEQLELKVDEASQQESQNELKINQLQYQYLNLYKALKELAQKIENENEGIKENIKIYKDIDSIMTVMDNVDSFSESFFSILRDASQLVTEQSMVTLIDDYENELADYLIVENHLKIQKKFEEDFEKNKIDKVEESRSKLLTDLENKKRSMQTKKDQLKSQFLEIKNILKDEIMAVQDYLQYQKSLKSLTELREEIQKLEKMDSTYKKNLIRSMHNLETIRFLQVRRNQGKYVNFQRKLMNIKKTQSMILDNYSRDHYIDESTADDIKNYFTSNQTRLQEINAKVENIEQHAANLEDLLSKEKQLDELFGLVLALLQGGQEAIPQHKKCLLTQELSNYMFYMSLFQIIISKTTVSTSLLVNLKQSQQETLIVQMFNDIQNKPFFFPDIIDPSTNALTSNGIEEAVKNYVLLVNNKLDLIFEDQINGTDEQYDSWYYTICTYAGFTKDIVIKALRKTGLGLIFKGLLTAILAFFSIAHVPVILVAFLGAFLVYITDLFISWLNPNFDHVDSYMPNFNLEIAKLYARFAQTPIDSLEYDEVLKEAEDAEYEKEKQDLLEHEEDDDRLEFFSKQFEEIISINRSFIMVSFENGYTSRLSIDTFQLSLAPFKGIFSIY